jgi:hypothetical protein
MWVDSVVLTSAFAPLLDNGTIVARLIEGCAVWLVERLVA